MKLCKVNILFLLLVCVLFTKIVAQTPLSHHDIQFDTRCSSLGNVFLGSVRPNVIENNSK